MAVTRRGRRVLAFLVVVAVVGVVATAVALWSRSGAVVVTERCLATADGARHDLAPDQSGNAATIAAVAVQRGLPARAVTIGIATAIQESKLRNIDYGDRDSLGLFQQRPSQGWGTPEQVTDPLYATNAFYDELVEIEGFEDLEITDAAQRVQRSAFGEAYADHEPVGRLFASALTGYSPAALTCRLRPVEEVDAGPTGSDGLTATAGAVRDAVLRELGEVSVTRDGDSGSVLRVDTGASPEGTRLGWAVAQWAVAQAGGRDVVRVSTDGREWRRDDPDAGWAGAEGAAPSGQVLVEVAGA